MTSLPDSERGVEGSRPAKAPVRYPKDHVLAIVPTVEQCSLAVDLLSKSGFRNSEITVLAGTAEADRLNASTGRTGLLNQIVRFADKIGVRDEEMEIKEVYEQALRDKEFVISVFTPSEERKQLAGDTLRQFGAEQIDYFGDLEITDLR